MQVSLVKGAAIGAAAVATIGFASPAGSASSGTNLMRASSVSASGATATSPSLGPYWQTVSTDGRWHCGSTREHSGSGVYFQGCTILSSAKTHSQTVLVVRAEPPLALPGPFIGRVDEVGAERPPAPVRPIRPGR